jgi:uncharacterized protein (DUF2249 family)
MTSTSQATAVVVASSAQDAAAVEAVKQHHAELAGRLTAHVEALLTAAARPADGGFEHARRAAVTFCTSELVPHAAAEEDTLYPAAASLEPARMLVDSMVAEHRVITGLVAELAETADPVRAAAAGYALLVLFDSHLTKENEQVLPLVAADPSASLAGILEGMHELLGPDEHAHEHGDAGQPSGQGGCGCGGCGCGASADADAPELDVRDVPHAIRHATVFGAFNAVPAGGSLVLVAPHDPIPLLEQLAARTDGGLAVSYEERGPQAWRLRLTKGA